MDDRYLKLLKSISSLPRPQFKQLLFALNPPRGLISKEQPLQETTKQLLNWVTSSNGPGLDLLEDSFGFIVNGVESSVPSGPDALLTLNRIKLINVISSIPTAQFEELVFVIKPPSGIVPPSSAAQGDRAAELLDWIEGPTGSGFDELLAILPKIIPEMEFGDLSIEENRKLWTQNPEKSDQTGEYIAQSFNNDAAEGGDLLGIEQEVQALAEVLVMRDLHPPIAVGILGGWGSGKSFVMHLMRERLKSIALQSVSEKAAWKLNADESPEELSPYVGHIYQIYFNSWTYAKADLWSSLMQTIFYELNCQLTIERHLRDTFAIYAAVSALMDKVISLKANHVDDADKINKFIDDLIRNRTQLEIDDIQRKASSLVKEAKTQKSSHESKIQKTEKFLDWLLEDRVRGGILLQILKPDFWRKNSEVYIKELAEPEKLVNDSTNESSQDSERNNKKNADFTVKDSGVLPGEKKLKVVKFSQPHEWQQTNWEKLQKNIDDCLGAEATNQFQAINVKNLYDIWQSAQKDACEKIREGGEIWNLLNSTFTAEERDEAIENEPSLGKVGLYIWQEIVGNAREQGVIWAELSNLRRRDQKELASIENSLITTEKALENEKKIAALAAQQKLEREQSTIIWKPLLNQAYELLGIDSSRVDTWRTLLTSNLHLSFKGYVALACIVALIVVSVSTSWQQRIEALHAIINAYRNIWMISFPVTAVLLPKIWAAVKQYLNDVKQSQAKLDTQYQEWLQEAQANSKLSDLSVKVEGLRLQAEQKRRQVGLIADHSSLLNFVNNRLQEDSYGRRLGLIHQISRDLEGLSQRLVYKGQTLSSENWKHIPELFPRGPARVILYIDDLDRCPPDRVVDVLEAVQLLIKTPLFVVVLAIDDRYIARSLENAYKGVLNRRGNPSGIDYLEKIIQIPYRTRPVARRVIGDYLKKHIEIEKRPEQTPVELLQYDAGDVPPVSANVERQGVSTESNQGIKNETNTVETDNIDNASLKVPPEKTVPPPPQVAKFTPEEFETLRKYCAEVNLSPRTAKRLINIYKILKILWFRSERDRQKNSEKIKESVLAMLVLSGRYPSFMREVLAEISRFYAEQQTESKTLQDCFEKPLEYLDQIKDPHLKRERDLFFHDVKSIIFHELSLNEIGEENFNLALSFCFVGDIGYDPEDYRFDNTASPEPKGTQKMALENLENAQYNNLSP